ncbi:MAG: helix-turn-helix domain-containing protein [Dehalococcoidia bacterium]|jgi:excisionase family DNA binding protein|nr:helix-turn-helix domain-containing protein [Dehalococcoidia bacterium]
MAEQKLAVSVPEAARMLSISTGTAWESVWRGDIPSFKVGTRRLVPVSALKRWIDESSVAKRDNLGGRVEEGEAA